MTATIPFGNAKYLRPFPPFLSLYLLLLLLPSFSLTSSLYSVTPYRRYSSKARNSTLKMSYGGRYADYDDEPSRRQAPREDVSFPSSPTSQGQADP